MKISIMKSALCGATCLTALGALGTASAYAQDAAGPADAQVQAQTDDLGDAIIVTGSRIARPDMATQSPVAVLGSDFIEQNAATNVQDILNEMPQVGIGTGRTNSNFLTGANGVATINLRNLGDERTLVLIDGKRVVPGIAGSSAVDVNNIPTDLLERIDVVTGGQSAIYGSDAIAGVVNFVLKDSFDGISLRAQSGLTSRADNARYTISLTGGQSFGGGRGNIMGNFTYDKDEGLFSNQRKISAQDCFFTTCGPAAYSSFSPQGRFEVIDGAGDPVNALNGGSVFSFDRDNNVILGEGEGYNRNAVRRISVPVERYMGTIIGNYEFTDSIKGYTQLSYSKVKSSSQIEASALQTSDLYDGGQGIPITNAFIPQSVRDQIAAYNATAASPITSLDFRRRQNEVFSRSNDAERDFYRAVVGVKGDISDRWQFDASYVYGRMKDVTRSQDIDSARYRNALDTAVVGGEIVCASAAARAEGCVPIDLFGFNTASPEASAYVQSTIPKSQRILNQQHVFSAGVSGTPITLPAGDVGVAFGLEYRKDKSVDDLDELTNIGGNSGNLIPDTRGSVTAKEVYGEVRIPILANTSFFELLELSGAARYSDYKGKGAIGGQSVTADIGSVFSWNVGADWEVVRGLRFRAAYAEASRAPNIGELFSAPGETFPGSTILDPCDGVSAGGFNPGTTTATQAAACRALPGFGANVAASSTGSFFSSQVDIQGINGFDGGNVGLKEETAKTFNVGAVFAPTSVPGLSVSVDYFRIKVSDAISTVPRNVSIGNCLETGDAAFCDNVIRSTRNGVLETINSQLINVAGLKTEGVDVNVQYSQALGLTPDDRFTAGIYYTYLIALEKQSFPNAPMEENRGQLFGDGRLGAGFKHKGTARLSYQTGAATISWQGTYLGKIQDTLGGYGDAELDALNRVGAKFYNDIQVRHTIGDDKRFEFYVGVDNIFDVQPPFLPSGFASSVTGTETAADTYDPFGRRYYAGFQARF